MGIVCCTTQKNKLNKVNPILQQNILSDERKFTFSSSDMVAQRYQSIQKYYKILDPPLGQGSFGEVRKAIHLISKQLRAIKIIRIKNQTLQQQKDLINEVEIIRNLDHPNIFKIYEYYQDKNFFYICSELCEGGELFDYIIKNRIISESKSIRIFKQLISAINYCHQHQIIHRDLKPENILLKKQNDINNIKIIDFGLSSHFNQIHANHIQGTFSYMAPEMFLETHNEKCDIWSCGVIFYIILFGQSPFYDKNELNVQKNILNGHYNKTSYQYKKGSTDCKQLIERMLEVDPQKRISAKEILELQFLKSFHKEKIINKEFIKNTLLILKDFKQFSKIQQAAQCMFIDYILTQSQQDQLVEVFQCLDKDCDGLLSAEELQKGYEQYTDISDAKEMVLQIINQIDNNKNGMIDIGEKKIIIQIIYYQNYILIQIKKIKFQSKQYSYVKIKNFLGGGRLSYFTVYQQKDLSGAISLEEFQTQFGNVTIDKKLWKSILKEIQIKTSNEISFKQFQQIILNMIKNDSINAQLQ